MSVFSEFAIMFVYLFSFLIMNLHRTTFVICYYYYDATYITLATASTYYLVCLVPEPEQ